MSLFVEQEVFGNCELKDKNKRKEFFNLANEILADLKPSHMQNKDFGLRLAKAFAGRFNEDFRTHRTFAEIGSSLDVSRTRAQKMYHEALSELRKSTGYRKLMPYIVYVNKYPRY